MNINDITLQTRLIMNNQNQRKKTAFITFMGPEYSEKPMETLESLENIIANYDNIFQENASDTWVLPLKQQIQNKINNNDYCIPGSPEWTYREAYMAKASTFIWPPPEEIAIQEQESQTIFNMLSNLDNQ